MDDKLVTDATIPSDDVVEKFKEAFSLQAWTALLKADADAKQKLADELYAKAEYHAKKARFWTKVCYGSLGVAFACLAFNLIHYHLRIHP
jgi:hypothetical protein